MGKHAAPEGASAHPLVAEALALRAADPAGTHRLRSGTGDGLGWPAPPAPGDGRGLGWPRRDDAAATPARAEGAPAGERPSATARGGWRRFFRVSSAA